MNIAVIGGHKCSKKQFHLAEKLGSLIAKEGWILICGGREGVMEGACLGVKKEGGISVGILPTYDGSDANKYVSIKIPTGLGYARNILVVRAADVVVAIGGSYGTLSEIAFALNEGKPILGIDTFKIKGIKQFKEPQSVIRYIKKYVKQSKNKAVNY